MQNEYVKINGRRIFYTYAGQGPTTLLIHGWPSSSYLWRHIIPELSPKARVIAPDLPGFGRSDKLRPGEEPCFELYKEFMAEFVRELNLHQIQLVVHDIGGPPALLWALANQERVASVVLLNTVLFAEAPWFDSAGQAFMRLPILKNLLATRYSLRRILATFTPNRPLGDDEVEDYLRPFPTAADRRALLLIINQCLYLGRRNELKDLASRLYEAAFPLAMFYGVRDPYCYYHMNRFYKEHPEPKKITRRVFEDMGHFIQEEATGRLAECMLDFYDY